jgi:hypothetical protein
MKNAVSLAARAALGAQRFIAVALVLFLFGLAAHAAEDPNEQLVDAAVGFLTTTFATIFTLGLGVVIALVAKKYLRKAS